MIRAILIWLLLAWPAAADEELVAGLSRTIISISADFDGSEILVYGAIKRDTPPPDSALGLIVTIAGPPAPVTVRRKSRVAGVWANTDAVDIRRAPTFYAVNTSGPFDTVLNQVADMRHKITVGQMITAIGASASVPDPGAFTEALVRLREDEDLYQTNVGAVRLQQDTLFDTTVRLPANLTEGSYEAHLYLTRNGRVISTATAFIDVEKVGLERFLYVSAHDQPFLYGVMSLVVAIAAGWAASAGFRWLKS